MSYVSELRKFYPRTWKERIALERYRLHCQWEGQEPTTITIHDTYLCYGGPEEGGWYYHQGHPLQTICIFSKKQAVNTYLQYSEEYEVWDQASLGLSTTESAVEINFGNDFAKQYPERRPHYC
jgi:hypothetical protein